MIIEINWSDLTLEKQEELKALGVWHENIELTPLAIVEIENSKEDDEDA